MHPIEFVMEMAGIAKVLGPDDLPTPTQWRRIHEMLSETMSPLVARKLFELGEEYEKQQSMKYGVIRDMLARDNATFGSAGVATYTTTNTGAGSLITCTVK